jgi:hypothetical protein
VRRPCRAVFLCGSPTVVAEQAETMQLITTIALTLLTIAAISEACGSGAHNASTLTTSPARAVTPV